MRIKLAIILFFLIITSKPLLSNTDSIPCIDSVKIDSVQTTVDPEIFIIETDTIKIDSLDERRVYWQSVVSEFIDSLPSKELVQKFCFKIMLLDSSGQIWGLSLSQRKALSSKLIRTAGKESTFGKYGIYHKTKNIVGKKIHGDFYKWSAVKARLNVAAFKHWTYSLLFLGEKVLFTVRSYRKCLTK
jgi:hypothetical protein